MQDEETGATELFPRLLQIIEIYPSSQKSFTELVSTLDCEPRHMKYNLITILLTASVSAMEIYR